MSLKRPLRKLGMAISEFAILNLLILSGCTVGPDFCKPKANITKNWYAQDPNVTNGQINQQWWKTFNDPVLDQLVEQAYRQNLPLQIAGLRILEARARLAIAIGEQYPQQQEVFGNVSRVRLSRNAVNVTGIPHDFWNYELGFDAVWELDFWGKYRRSIESQQAILIASVADYDNALVSLVAEVGRTYTVIRTFESLIELARQNARVQKEGLQIAESRFRNGATTELDVTQARSLLESTLASIPRLQIGLEQSQNALSTLLGQPVGPVRTRLEQQKKPIPVAPTRVAVGMPAELLRRRPDIRSAELLAAAQSARIGVAKADLYPSFALSGQIGFQTTSTNGLNFEHLFDGGSLFYNAGPTFNWPILNYGRIKNSVRVQDAQFQQLLVNYENTVLRAAQEVEDSMVGYIKAQQTRVFEQNSVAAAQRSVEIALSQYREGAVDYQRVLDTQRELLQQQNNLTQTNSDISTNLIALYKALGGGWELSIGKPFVPAATVTEMRQRTDWGRILPAEPLPQSLNPPKPAREMPLLQRPDW